MSTVRMEVHGQNKRIRAEAASWVARLHGPERNAEVEMGLKRWLAESPAHMLAFEKATDVWQETADLPDEMPTTPLRYAPAVARWRGLALAAGIAGLLVAALLFDLRGAALTTAVGEQRSLTLEDGTRVELNTGSRLRVRYDEHERRVELEEGEAFFDVAKLKSRPFVVIAGPRRIVALGTTFVVRRDGEAVSVMLVEGKVAVAPADPRQASPATEKILDPGQRLRFGAAGHASLDSPPVEKIVAWQRGQLIFENTPLREAVAEFNRYSAYRILLEGNLDDVPVGGVFRIGDYLSFVQAVADAHDLHVQRRDDEVVLSRISRR